MHILIAGPTGTLGTELIRQALSHPAIMTVTAFGRRETPIPPKEKLYPGAEVGKLRSVVVEDFLGYEESENVREKLRGLRGVIWTIAIMRARTKVHGWEEVTRVSINYAVYGIKTMTQFHKDDTDGNKKPLRFIYISGVTAVRDPSKNSAVLEDYSLMRGEAESKIFSYAEESSDAVQAAIAKPGLIITEVERGLPQNRIQLPPGFPTVELKSIAAVLLEQVVREGGMEKETFFNEDLVSMGRVLQERKL